MAMLIYQRAGYMIYIYIYPFHILIICPHGWFSPSKISQMCLFIMFKASLFPSMMTFHGTRIWASDSWEQKHSCPIYQPPKRYIYIYMHIHIYIYTHTDTHISMILALVSEFTWCFPCFFHVFPAFIRHFSILLVGGKWFLFPLRSHPHGFRISVARCLRRPWDEGISTTFWLKPINVVIPLLTMYIYIYTYFYIHTRYMYIYIYNIIYR